APVMRTASIAVKPCQEDSSEFYLITGSIYTDQRGTVVIATVFDEVTKTLSSISEAKDHLQVKLKRTSSSLKSKITTSCSQDEVNEIKNGLIVLKHGTGNLGEVIKKYSTIMLEAVASYDLWIWHAFFGVASANNDLTVLNDSPLFDDLLDDIAPMVPYEVNEVMFEKGYYLADGIYPQWATFVKSFTVERDERNAVFKHC
ncbi:ALP1-like protein, partial [Tanacetum coccineum]